MRTRCIDGFLWVPELFLPPKIIRPFFTQNMLSWAYIGLAGSFGVLLVGWLVVVARGLYLARHLFTLFDLFVGSTFVIS